MGLELRGTVALDGSGWEAGLNKLHRSTAQFAGSLKTIALQAFGLFTVGEAIKRTVEYGERLIDTSRRLGVSVETLQEFTFAARQSGSSMEALTGFIERLNSARIDPQKAASFKALGITGEDLKSLQIEDLMMKISANVRLRSSQEIIGPLRQVGGRGAGELIPMLKDDMAKLGEEAQRLGQVMRLEDAVSLKFIADEFKVLSQVLVIGLAPAINFVLQAVLGFINKIKSFGTFWGDLSGNPDFNLKTFFKSLLDKPMSGGLLDTKYAPGSAADRFGKAIAHAGKEAENVNEELDDALQKQIKALIDRQKEIEKINAMPDFSGATGTHGIATIETPGKGRVRDEADSLVRVGNFLGSSKDVLQALAQRQVTLLQEIAKNTSPREQHNTMDMIDFPI